MILARLEKLQGLRLQGIELILVDGGSTDNTLELAQGLVDRVVGSSRGRAVQMNAGAAAAQGEYLVFLHLDTGLPAGFVEHLKSWRQSREAWGFFRVKLSGKSPCFRIIEWAMNWRSRISRIGTGDQVIFIRSDFFKRLGGYANIPLMEDVELCKRLRKLSAPCIVKDCVTTSSRRWEEQGVIRTVLLMWQLRLGYFLGVAPERLVKRYDKKTDD